MAIIQFANVSVALQNKSILSDVSFAVNKSEFVYLIGRTGAGKSTLLKLIYADVKPNSGHITVCDYNIDQIKPKDVPYLRRKIGIVFQDYQLLPDLTIGDNLAFVMKATGWRETVKIRDRIVELLMLVGLSSKLDMYPHQISGGEQQRAVIARALVNEPHVLIADEPTGNLDPEVTVHIMDILHKVNRAGTAIFMATHEHSLIEKYPARVLECIEGDIRESNRFSSK